MLPPKTYGEHKIDEELKFKYCVIVIGTDNDYWINTKLLTKEFETMEQAESERILVRNLLKLKDKNMLILQFTAEQEWVKQCILKG